jgi:nucleoside-diphosphate-sugar epimerase
LKNHLNKKKLVIGYTGTKSVLAKSFVKSYYKNFILKSYAGDITNYAKVDSWLRKNLDINIFINFAAITSTTICEKNKKKATDVNFISAIKLLNLLNNIQMIDFNYFLSLSTSHVFKKSHLKLKENSTKEPTNHYGVSKLALENYILKNQKKFKFKIGIARIFNYYNGGSKKGFFINDIIEKLKVKKKIIKFDNVNSYRDYISMKDINTAFFKMINLRLINDYNICSGEKIYLPDIINHLNKKYKKNIFILNDKRNEDLIGSNSKLKKKGWKITKKSFFNELLK